ncbi:hypothetical protein EVAR_50941_1 [Eumeta japonica]|uniref:Uncharacterized protein n=1 Tax=Eumeta variegata TaxID=151549 RepID=A0A4C1XE96_EUMVA|nr:hypothetical protein EVAR_50941_1 [Eumeta japonica]
MAVETKKSVKPQNLLSAVSQISQIREKAEFPVAKTASVIAKAVNEGSPASQRRRTPKLLVEVETTDGVAAQSRETDEGVFTAIKAVRDFAKPTMAKLNVVWLHAAARDGGCPL